MPPQQYTYSKIAGHREFRILTLRPNSNLADESIRCEISHHAIPRGSNADVTYEALSWTWGTEREEHGVVLTVLEPSQEDDEDGLLLTVKPNLGAALKALRLPNERRRLWVDFVCIDQSNDHEKNQQVQMMSSIYSNAFNVCIWLGDENDRGDRAMGFIERQTGEGSEFGTQARDTLFGSEIYGLYAFAGLLARAWFRRRWVVQEVAQAKSATVHVGREFVAWERFESAVTRFEEFSRHFEQLEKSSKMHPIRHPLIKNVAAMGAARLVRTKSEVFQRNTNGDITEYRFTLSQLVANLFDFEAQRPHDIIYSLLSLASDTHSPAQDSQDSQTASAQESGANSIRNGSAEGTRLPPEHIHERIQDLYPSHCAVFPVNYENSFLEVCKEFLHHVMSKTTFPNLDILCYPWAPEGETDLPSWVRSATDAPHSRREDRDEPPSEEDSLMWRKNADPLSEPTPGWSYYNACGGRTACATGEDRDWYFGSRGGPDRRLYATGFVLDRIDEIEQTSRNGNIPARWFSLAQWEPWTEEDQSGSKPPPDELWQTLVADRGVDGSYAKEDLRTSFQLCARRSDPIRGLWTTLLGHVGDFAADFLFRFEAAACNRRLFRSKIEGRLGLAPEKAQSGDAVCILRGCSVPVILRAKDGDVQADGSPHTFYEVIGSCYLHTMMYGAALESQKARGIPDEKFELH